MTDTKQASLIEKIKKLFAIANRKTNNDGSSNEAEATAAMNMAQELLTKYNLDLAAITDTVKDKTSTQPVSGPREKVRINRSAMYRWQQEFWKNLAEMNYCWHWTVEISEEHPRRKGYIRRVKRHIILGSAANVAAVQVMGEYLTETIERILPYDNANSLSKAALSWREGCAERLIERIREKMEAMKSEGFKAEDGTQVTALAVRSLEDLEYAANWDGKYGKGSWQRKLDYEANWEAKREEREKEYEEMLQRDALAQSKETDAQRRKREAKEERERARWWRRHQREEEREMNRLDGDAYRAGHKAGNTVNLSDQLKKG